MIGWTKMNKLEHLKKTYTKCEKRLQDIESKRSEMLERGIDPNSFWFKLNTSLHDKAKESMKKMEEKIMIEEMKQP